MAKSRKTHITTGHITPPHAQRGLQFIIERIVLVVFLPDSNGRRCAQHPFGCGNALVLNRDAMGVGLRLRLRSFVRNKLACYTMNADGSDGCRECFTAGEYAAGSNDCRLDSVIIEITDVSSAEHNNHSMHYLFHCNYRYASAVVLPYH